MAILYTQEESYLTVVLRKYRAFPFHSQLLRESSPKSADIVDIQSHCSQRQRNNTPSKHKKWKQHKFTCQHLNNLENLFLNTNSTKVGCVFAIYIWLYVRILLKVCFEAAKKLFSLVSCLKSNSFYRFSTFSFNDCHLLSVPNVNFLISFID